MPETAFIITIDTEGDDLWARPREVTTRNAQYVPRFQSLCERYGFKAVYLTTWEMAGCDAFVEFGRDVLARGTGEVGMHLHAWNSPPLDTLTSDDLHFQPYLMEYPDAVMRQKIKVLTALLEERFESDLISHRAGRWGLDGRYASMLLDEGYRVDCSVTPGVDWGAALGDPGGNGGPDYTDFPEQPYLADPSDISHPAQRGLLEVPVTVRVSRLYRRAPWVYRVRSPWRALNGGVSPALFWLSPGENDIGGMLRAAHAARREGTAHVELALHSSELMPGGSPSFRTAGDIERLYEQLEILFDNLAGWCRGMTLREFHAEFAARAS